MNLKASSTLGFERRFNRALQAIPQGKDFFIESLTADLPAHSPSFDNIIAINRAGPPDHDTPLEMISSGEVKDFLAQNGVALDVRDGSVYAEEHVLGSINIPLSGGQVAGRAGWLIEPEENVLVVAENEEQARAVAGELGSIRAGGRLAWLEGGLEAWKATGGETASLPQLSARELDEMLQQGEIDTVVDVREPDEWRSNHIEGALNISHREMRQRWPELDKDSRIAVICAGGLRSVIAASVLESNGFSRIYNIKGGMGSWQRIRQAATV
jgi:rhodanese-related sulfurtransferase